MYYYGIDYYYIVLVLPALLISLYAQFKVSTSFSKYSKVTNSKRMTGAEVARKILNSNSLHNVNIEHVSGNLSDHYDPRTRTLRLSDSVYSSTSIAALGVAAHECGHAIQHAQNYSPLVLRHAVYPIVSFSSVAATPLFVIGLLLNTPQLITFGIILFSAVVAFQIITLPVEFNASRRALKILGSSYFLDDEEIKSAKKVLAAAALTYVASALISVMQLLRLILISKNRRD